MTAVSSTDPAVCVWEQLLDDLEAHLARAERAAAGRDDALPGWKPPTGVGPVPAALLPRVHALLERQQQLISLLPGLIERIRRHAAVADRVSHADRHRAPVYIDVSA